MGKFRMLFNKLTALLPRKGHYADHWPRHFAIVNNNRSNEIKVWVESYHEPDFDYSRILKRLTDNSANDDLVHAALSHGWKPASTTIMLQMLYDIILGTGGEARGIPHDQLVIMYMELLGKQFRNLSEAIKYLRALYESSAEDFLSDLADKEDEDILDAELDEEVEEYINSQDVLDELENKRVIDGLSSVKIDELLADMAVAYKRKLKGETDNGTKGHLKIIE